VKNDLAQVQRRVGRRISELRAAIGTTQEQLAEGSGLDVRYVQRIEAGEINLTLESLVRLANVLRVPVDSIFQRPTREPTKTSSPSAQLRNASPRKKK
jgi:transcriptional regulator with XRE-family HTH domain